MRCLRLRHSLLSEGGPDSVLPKPNRTLCVATGLRCLSKLTSSNIGIRRRISREPPTTSGFLLDPRVRSDGGVRFVPSLNPHNPPFSSQWFTSGEMKLTNGTANVFQISTRQIQLPESVASITGCTHTIITLGYNTVDPGHLPVFQISPFLTELEYAVAQSKIPGLVGFLLALSKIPGPLSGSDTAKLLVRGEMLPTDSLWNKSTFRPRWLSMVQDEKSTFVEGTFNWSTPPITLKVRAKAPKGGHSSLEIPIRVTVHARLAKAAVAQNHSEANQRSDSAGQAHEIYVLDQFLIEVCQRIAAEMVFDDFAVIPVQLSKALLDTSEAISSLWDVRNVSVSTASYESNTDFNCRAISSKQHIIESVIKTESELDCAEAVKTYHNTASKQHTGDDVLVNARKAADLSVNSNETAGRSGSEGQGSDGWRDVILQSFAYKHSSKRLPDIDNSALMANLEQFCVDSGKRGLAAMLVGLHRVNLPGQVSCLTRASLSGNSADGMIGVASEGRNLGWTLHARQPILRSLQSQKLGYPVRVSGVKLRVKGWDSPIDCTILERTSLKLADGALGLDVLETERHQKPATVPGEILLLDRFMNEVTRRVATEMVFESPEDVTIQIARALLATSEAIASVWDLKRVSVCLHSPAFHQQPRTSLDKEVSDRSRNGSEIETAPGEGETLEFDRTGAVKDPHASSVRRGSHSIHLVRPFVQSTALSKNNGVQYFELNIYWSQAAIEAWEDVDRLYVVAKTSEALTNIRSEGVHGLEEALLALVASLPRIPSIRLRVVGQRNNWCRKFGGTPAKWVAHLCRGFPPAVEGCRREERMWLEYEVPHFDHMTWKIGGMSVQPGTYAIEVKFLRFPPVYSEDSVAQTLEDTMRQLYTHTKHILQDIYESDFESEQLAASAIAQRLVDEPITPSSIANLMEVRASFQIFGAWKYKASRLRAQYTSRSEMHRSFVALGSNMGDRQAMLETACKQIAAEDGITLRRTSSLYETKAMYVEAQDAFLNGACELTTTLPPLELLDRMQAIETRLGRVRTIEKGPRSIDLDILTYDWAIIDTERLQVPHKLMTEREFVLRPLRDISSARYFNLPTTKQGIDAHLLQVLSSPSQLSTYMSLAPGCQPILALDPKRSTRIMSVLNLTPDSFSDGGQHSPTDVETLRKTLLSQIAAGATLIDIGGQSSRPNAPNVSADEEISRILPAIEVIKALPEAAGIAISVDTYRAAVAEAAINAGAHIINDISAGLLDDDMLVTVAKLGCTYVMMHMRGTPATMTSAENCSYPAGLLSTVAAELAARVEAGQAAGILRWRIILDPGIGFAKTQDQNLELLRGLHTLRAHPELQGLPLLVGASRKGFIGNITGVAEASERSWGTAATVTAAIQGGADIVRVHDVAEMAKVAKMSDAVWRM